MGTQPNPPRNASRPPHRDHKGADKPRMEAGGSGFEHAKPSTPRHSGGGGGQQRKCLEHATVILALIAALGSISAAAFAGWQAFISSDTEKRQLRSYLGVSDVKFNCCGVAYYGPDYQENKSVVNVTIKNGGQTPASYVSAHIGFASFPKGSNYPANIDYSHLVTTGKAEQTDKGVIIHPATYYMLDGMTKTFSAVGNAVQLLRTKSHLENTIVYGTIDYQDIFGTFRYLDFCVVWEVYADDTESYADCPEHNRERS